MRRKAVLKKMTQEDVNQIVDEQENGLPINFKNCDLSGLDLSGKNLKYVIFEDCNLNGVNFSKTIINQGEFKNGLLIGGNFEEADLSGVDFTSCAMQRVNLSHVMIEGVGIKESNLAHANLKNSTIEYSNLNVFKDVNLSDADLSGSNISWFRGENVNFSNAKFTGSSILESEIKDCIFTNASLENAALYSVSFTDCEMQKSILSNAKITNVIFDNSTLENADFRQSEIDYGNFVDSNLDGVDFRGVALSSVNEFRNVSLIAADFSEATISDGSKLYNSNLADVKGLDASHAQNLITEPRETVETLQRNELSLINDYQYHLNLFIARYFGSEVNAEVDSKIAQTLLEQGYDSLSIESVIAAHSPNVPKESAHAKTYAMNIVKMANKRKANSK